MDSKASRGFFARHFIPPEELGRCHAVLSSVNELSEGRLLQVSHAEIESE